MKYLLIPLYVYSWFSIFSILGQYKLLFIMFIACFNSAESFLYFLLTGKSQRKIWAFAYFLACAAVLIPAPLIEFRYYTIPFFFFVLHSDINDYRSWLLMGTLYIAINIVTLHMFLFRPFYWSHEPGIQRFIW